MDGAGGLVPILPGVWDLVGSRVVISGTKISSKVAVQTGAYVLIVDSPWKTLRPLACHSQKIEYD